MHLFLLVAGTKMVLCWIALPVFAFLSIFSVRYRRLARESLKCLFKTAVMQKCDSELNQKIRSDISGRLMKISPGISKLFYNYYKIITFVLLIVILLSAYFSIAGIYNYIKYGSCNGPSSDGFCIFDPTGKNSATSRVYGLNDWEIGKVVLPKVSTDDPIIGNKNASLTIIEFGCYQCPYTKKAEPIVQEVLEHYNGRVNLQFKSFEIPNHALSYQTGLAADCAYEQGADKYLKYHKKLFENQENTTYFSMVDYAAEPEVGLDIKNFTACLVTEKYKNEVRNDTIEGLKAGVEGTPTFFINGQKIVGPKPFKTFKAVIDDELEKIEEQKG